MRFYYGRRFEPEIFGEKCGGDGAIEERPRYEHKKRGRMGFDETHGHRIGQTNPAQVSIYSMAI